MSGINSFLDYDASRNHTRGGFGLEYSRDYLKLSTNSYFSLSGWKNSPDKEDYEERPASGWDIRAEGYLSAWPNLDGKLTYKQYYGDQVALFGVDKLEKHSRALLSG
ncbi:hypothetical protein BJP41_06385 [Candidatus Williamhamiltonella defendens]|uniref:Inverse autotransporter beta-domain domain-containing protein n=1 Tax=Candidatus Williamhamiltonella defendens TaxID=138072 RepID=A0A2D3T2J6_9ENTR|nr:hypothetical protein CJJ18_08875 [Candidatus Hamiltonella defensa]ATW30017.1 hypothetical protein BJP41_06385 [Candidatus Hamiltonella defensa]AWK17021.1 hypothetical protein CCS40_08695 [Candidatus Hamiltonella defensa]MBK4362247.1 hypothetical protein [Candidatus Hamiltonella defensa]